MMKVSKTLNLIKTYKLNPVTVAGKKVHIFNQNDPLAAFELGTKGYLY